MSHAEQGVTARAERGVLANVADRFVVPFGAPRDLRCHWKAWSCRKCDEVAMATYDFERVLQDLDVRARAPHAGARIEPLVVAASRVRIVLATVSGG